MKFSEAFGVYRELVLSSQTRREITSELGRWEKHVSPVLGEYQLDKIRNLQILQLKKSLEAKKLSPQSVYHCLSLSLSCSQNLAQGRRMGTVSRTGPTVQDAEI